MPENVHRPVFILTGETGSGKTTFLLELIEALRQHKLSIAGFAAVSVPADGASNAYDILDLVSGKVHPLASRRETEGWEACGKFYFNPEGILMGSKILDDAQNTGHDLIVLDEIGPFELAGRIWSESLTALLAKRTGAVLLVVRASLVEKVREKWSLREARVMDIAHTDPAQAAAVIRSRIREMNG